MLRAQRRCITHTADGNQPKALDSVLTAVQCTWASSSSSAAGRAQALTLPSIMPASRRCAPSGAAASPARPAGPEQVRQQAKHVTAAWAGGDKTWLARPGSDEGSPAGLLVRMEGGQLAKARWVSWTKPLTKPCTGAQGPSSDSVHRQDLSLGVVQQGPYQKHPDSQ